LILFGVGSSRSAEERHAHNVPEGRKAVLGLGQKGNTVSVFAQVSILWHDLAGFRTRYERTAYLVTADLELGDVPCRVLVRRALDVTELRLVGRVVIVYVHRNLDCRGNQIC
jgi:hypothetical protein